MSTIPPLSVLDLSPIPEGADAGQALRNSADLARHVEALGYRRYWMAEHHNMPGIASAVSVLLFLVSLLLIIPLFAVRRQANEAKLA